ncbi:MAG TPA: PLP-dependent aminotransferase family protein [Propionibacteriaceae bacterium]
MPSQWISPAQVTTLLGPAALSSPAYRDLADRLRLQIVDGRLTTGVRLPSERALAVALGLSRTTVAAAYARLGELGYLRAQQGSGNYVTLPRSGRTSLPSGIGAATDEPISLTKACSSAPPGLGSVFLRATEQLPELLAGSGYLADGLPVLRERLAAWFTGRGLPTDAGQIIVTTGALSALNTVLRTLVGPGDRVVMESPTYPGAIEAVRRSGARPVGYPLGPEGWAAHDLDLVLRQTAPRLTFLIPEFHNPTAATMPAAVRAEVGASVQRNRTQLVIDETLLELRLEDQPPLPPLASYVPDALTVGSSSKAYWGGLRIGWIRAPRALVPALIETRAIDDLGSSAFEQLVVAELLAEGGSVLAEHRVRLRDQRDLLVTAVREAFPEWEVARPDGGLSLWAQLPSEVSTRMAALADRYGLVTTAGPRFFVGGGGERHLRIPYGENPTRLLLAVERLTALWRAAASGRSAGPISMPLSLTA